MRIVIADACTPFVENDSTHRLQALVAGMRARGHEVEVVALPFDAQASNPLAQAAAWRLLDLDRSNMRPIDLLVSTGFPSYFVRHPRKVVLMPSASGATARPAMDARMLAECAKVVPLPAGAGESPAALDSVIEQLLG